MQRPSESPQYPPKTQFRVKSSTVNGLDQGGWISCQKLFSFLWKTCVLLVRAAGPPWGQSQVSVLSLSIRLSLCVASHSACKCTALTDLEVH